MEKKYWEKNLGDIDIKLNLFKNDSEILCSKNQCQEYSIKLNCTLIDKILKLCKKNQLLLYSYMIANMDVLLYKYAGKKDLSVLIQEEDRYIIIRNFIDDNIKFNQLLLETKEQVYNDSILLNDTELQNKIYKIIMDCKKDNKEKYQNLKKFYFKIGLITIENEYHMQVIYNTSLFADSSIELFINNYIYIMNQTINNVNINLKEICPVCEEERRFIFDAFNSVNFDITDNKTLVDLFEEQVDKAPNNVAITWNDRKTSYIELDEQSNKLAQFLNVHCINRTQNTIGILIDSSVDQVVSVIAALKAGCTYVPISTKSPEDRIINIITDSNIQCLVSSKKYIRLLNRLMWKCKSLDYYLCIDSLDVFIEIESDSPKFMEKELWDYVSEEATDDIEAGGWKNSYTGEKFSMKEMDEYASNIFVKLRPYLSKDIKVLEIGCGSGLTMLKIAPLVKEYYATDLSSSMIKRNQLKVKDLGYDNIKFKCLSADEIDKVEETDFDLIIMNSVVQAFPGHNYLRMVIRKCLDKLKEGGHIFIGDVMDLEKQDYLINSLNEYKQKKRQENTKTDLTAELFIHKDYFKDLEIEIDEINNILFSNKICTIENELTKFRYDILISKTYNVNKECLKKKNQYDINSLKDLPITRLNKQIAYESLAYIIYTSGSTGRPKGVMVEHKAISEKIQWRKKEYSLNHSDNVLQLFSYSFDGFLTSLFTPLISGSNLVIIDEDDMKDIYQIKKIIKEEEITHFIVVPSLYSCLLSIMIRDELLTLKKITLAGEAVSRKLVKLSKEKFKNIELINEYGPTENAVVTTIYRDLGKERRILIGKPVANSKVYLCDKEGDVVPVGAIGEMCISGPELARGYINSENLNREKFVNNKVLHKDRLYKTGDLGRWMRDGNIEYIGRKDEQIKVRGYRVEIGEIENILSELDNIKASFILQDEISGELYAYIYSNEEILVKDIREYLLKKLPDYMVPSHFIQIENIPLNNSGKVDKKCLSQLNKKHIIANEYIGPSNYIEKEIVEIWKNVFSIENISIIDNFYDLGGHSLKAIRIIAEIYKKLNINIPLKIFFKKQTIKELSEYIFTSKRNIFYNIKNIKTNDNYKLSSPQKRLFLSEQFNYNGTKYNMPSAIKIIGKINIEHLRYAINKIIERHEILRTYFVIENGIPMQKISDNLHINIIFEKCSETEINKISKKFVQQFNLNQLPLIRMKLLEIEERHFILLYDMHHIISDGVSIDIFEKELFNIYEGNKLEVLNIQYKDYADWQNKFIEGNIVSKQKDYWLDKLNNFTFTKIIEDSMDNKKSSVCSRVFYTKDSKLKMQIDDYCSKKRISKFVLFLSSFYITIYSELSQNDLTIATPFAGRNHTDLNNLIGFFLNILLLRTKINLNEIFADFIYEVNDIVIEAQDNSDYPYELLFTEINDKNFNLYINGLFSIMFNYLPEVEIAKCKGLAYTHIDLFETENKYDISFFIEENLDSVILKVIYGVDYNNNFINKIIDNFEKIISVVINNDNLTIFDIIKNFNKVEGHKLEDFSNLYE